MEMRHPFGEAAEVMQEFLSQTRRWRHRLDTAMKTFTKRIAAIAALLGIVAFTVSHAFNVNTIQVDYRPWWQAPGWNAQADAFWGELGGEETYWGWTSASYYRYGYPLDLHWANWGRDNEWQWRIPPGEAGYVWDAYYCYASKYWRDADWTAVESFVQTVSGDWMYATVYMTD
jgi:hypothetical protein